MAASAQTAKRFTHRGARGHLVLHEDQTSVTRNLGEATHGTAEFYDMRTRITRELVERKGFNIVAVDDFNMGAMENKGLNIFNSSAVLASPETSTDTNFERIEAIIAH